MTMNLAIARCVLQSERFTSTRSMCGLAKKIDEYKPKPIHGEVYPEWRTPTSHNPLEWHSKFKLFAMESKNTRFLQFMQKPVDLWPSTVKAWWIRKKEEIVVLNQSYMEARNKVLGDDLAAAHFIAYRGGSVKLRGVEKWITIDENQMDVPLPNVYTGGMYVECLDCENIEDGGLRYEGLENLRNLRVLKWLSLKGNRHINDWGLDKLSSLQTDNLEYLDLQGCNITFRGLIAFYRLTNLKMLILSSDQITAEMDMVLAMLQESNKDLLIKINDVETKVENKV